MADELAVKWRDAIADHVRKLGLYSAASSNGVLVCQFVSSSEQLETSAWTGDPPEHSDELADWILVQPVETCCAMEHGLTQRDIQLQWKIDPTFILWIVLKREAVDPPPPPPARC